MQSLQKSGGGLDARTVLQLQRDHGNQFVQNMLKQRDSQITAQRAPKKSTEPITFDTDDAAQFEKHLSETLDHLYSTTVGDIIGNLPLAEQKQFLDFTRRYEKAPPEILFSLILQHPFHGPFLEEKMTARFNTVEFEFISAAVSYFQSPSLRALEIMTPAINAKAINISGSLQLLLEKSAAAKSLELGQGTRTRSKNVSREDRPIFDSLTSNSK